MAIQKLAVEVSRTIGAAQVLNDPSAVIKELIDNALDANATSVAIEISTNTLDVIQVRDNGHGIAPDDRIMVARPNTTSKLTDIGDLESLGGTSLGFRGQALAAAAEMSGSLTISTRVEGEQVAIALKIDHHGEVVSQERTSLPVGTTVKVTDFVKAQPVRRQFLLKNAEKCLKSIKQTLQAYAFARPHVRLSLRVLKAKNDKGNWMYAPKTGGNAEDAAFKIVGAACASQCDWSVLEEKGFRLQTFLPRANAEPQKISNVGAFISVDGRPVSSTRGTFKHLVKTFRDALKKSNTAFENIKEPFLYMSLQCPASSYDPNVEPAKDDLLFEVPEDVIDIARHLFAVVYPSTPEASEVRPAGQSLRAPAFPMVSAILADDDDDDDDEEFVTSLERPPRQLSGAQPAERYSPYLSSHLFSTPADSEAHGDSEQSTRAGHDLRFIPNMYDVEDEDDQALGAPRLTERVEADREEIRQARNDVNINNPWVIAKLNTSLRLPRPAETESSQYLPEDGIPSDSPVRQRQPPQFSFNEQRLPTSRPSSPSPPHDRPGLSQQVRSMYMAQDDAPSELQSEASYTPLVNAGEGDQAMAHDRYPDQLLRPREQYNMQSPTPQRIPLDMMPISRPRAKPSPRKTNQTQINRPFVMPLHDQGPREKVWFDHLEEAARPRARRHRPNRQMNSDGLVQQGELGVLLEEPRLLTPLQRNRDIREFVSSTDLSDRGSAASLVEGRHYGLQSLPQPTGQDNNEPMLTATSGNSGPVRSVLYGGGFMPASELEAISAHVDQSPALNSSPARRHSAGRPRALRVISSNARIPSTRRVDEAAQPLKRRKTGESGPEAGTHVERIDVAESDGERDYRPKSKGRSASARRPTTEGRRRRINTARLPLERVPAGQATHHLVCTLANSTREISRSAAKMDEQSSLLKWNEPAVDAINAFASAPDPTEMVALTAKLHELLVDRVSDREMVQDLSELVQRALEESMKGDVMEGMSSTPPS